MVERVPGKQNIDPAIANCELESKDGRPPKCPISAVVVEIMKYPEIMITSGLLDACTACKTDPEIPIKLAEIDEKGYLLGPETKRIMRYKSQS